MTDSAATLGELEARRDAITDPALKQKMMEEDDAIFKAYEKLSADWDMAEFFDLMNENRDKWYQKYKDDEARIKKINRVARIKSEPLEVTGIGYSKSPFESVQTEFVSLSLGETGTMIKVPLTKVSYEGAPASYIPEKAVGGKLATTMANIESQKDSVGRYQKADSHIDTKNMSMFLNLEHWLLFSAASCPTGNVGQANYTAGNCLLESVTHVMRQARPGNSFFSCIQWGAVGGIGMRWKAFATQDFLQQVEGFLMTINESAALLRALLTNRSMDCCEVVTAQIQDSGMFAMQNPPGPPPTGHMAMVFGRPRGMEGFGDGGGAGGGRPDVQGIQTAAIMALQDPENRTLEVNTFQMLCGGNPGVGTRVTLFRMKNKWELNRLTGEVTEELDGGNWLVRLDDDKCEELIANGYVDPDLLKEKKSIEEEFKDVVKPKAPDGRDPYCIAGTWDDYLPHEMDWDTELGCYKFYLNLLGRGCKMYFVKGRPSGKKLKYKGKQWSIPKANEGGVWYEVRLFLKDTGTIKSVEMPRTAEPPDDDTFAITAGDAE